MYLTEALKISAVANKLKINEPGDSHPKGYARLVCDKPYDILRLGEPRIVHIDGGRSLIPYNQNNVRSDIDRIYFYEILFRDDWEPVYD